LFGNVTHSSLLTGWSLFGDWPGWQRKKSPGSLLLFHEERFSSSRHEKSIKRRRRTTMLAIQRPYVSLTGLVVWST